MNITIVGGGNMARALLGGQESRLLRSLVAGPESPADF